MVRQLFRHVRFLIEGEEFLWPGDAAQGVASDGYEPAVGFADGAGEGRGDQHRLVDIAAHVGDPAYFVDRRADDGKIEAFAAADVAIKNFADVKTQLHIGGRQALGGAPVVHHGDRSACLSRGIERRMAGGGAIRCGEDRQRAVADQFEHIAAVLVNR